MLLTHFWVCFIDYHMCKSICFKTIRYVKSISCFVDAHGRRGVLLCWWPGEGNAFSIVYATVQINVFILVLEPYMHTFVARANLSCTCTYRSPCLEPLRADRVILCFQQYLQPFWSFWHSCNNCKHLQT